MVCKKNHHLIFFFFQAEDGIRDRSPSRGLGDVYKRQRLFSKKYLKDTKIFENEFQDFIVSTAKIYAKELLDDAMNDSEILSALLIEDYAQELALKGPLHLKWEDGTEIHNEDWRYGNILNSDTLRYAPGSYTHLTLPTKRRMEIAGVDVTFKN